MSSPNGNANAPSLPGSVEIDSGATAPASATPSSPMTDHVVIPVQSTPTPAPNAQPPPRPVQAFNSANMLGGTQKAYYVLHRDGTITKEVDEPDWQVTLLDQCCEQHKIGTSLMLCGCFLVLILLCAFALYMIVRYA